MFKSGKGLRLPYSIPIPSFRRSTSTALHFYQNRQLDLYAAKEAKRLTLRQLVCSSKQIFKSNWRVLPLLGLFWAPYERRATYYCELLQKSLPSTHNRSDNPQSANYVRTELPVRIAHRLRDLQALPYVVVTQEGVAKVYEVRILWQSATSTVLSNTTQLYWSAFNKCVSIRPAFSQP